MTPGYSRVVDGLDVVDNIKGVSSGKRSGHQDVPLDSIEIIETTVSEDYLAR